MISEGSCDNDAESSYLITGINYMSLYIHIENSYFQMLIIFHNITVFFTVFQIK